MAGGGGLACRNVFMAARIASWFGPIRFFRLPFNKLQIVDAGTPEAKESVIWLTPVASKKDLISSAIVFMKKILTDSNLIGNLKLEQVN